MRLVKSGRLVQKERNNSVFVYNTVLGNLSKIGHPESQVLDYFDTPKEIGVPASRIQELVDKNFLHTPDRDEYTLLEEQYPKLRSKIQRGELLRKLQLVVTTRCNLDCTYCYEKDIGPERAPNTDMDIDTAKKAVDNFFDIAEENEQSKVYIRYFGGEPLVNWKLIEEVSDYIEENNRGIEVVECINTNGTLMNDHIASFISKKGFDIDVSLDSPGKDNDIYRVYKKGCKQRGSFDDVDKALELLAYYNAEVEVSAQLNDYNLYQLREFVDYVAAKGVGALEINTLIDDKDGLCNASIDERVDALMDVLDYAEQKGVEIEGKWRRLYNNTADAVLNYCSRCGEQFSVNPDGRIYPCSGVDKELGHIDAPKEVFTQDNYLNLAMRIVGRIDGCKECPIEGMCAGGCVAAADAQMENAEGYTYEIKECDFRKSVVDAQIGRKIEIEDPAYMTKQKSLFDDEKTKFPEKS